ncbi:prepilin [Bordetella petrii]|uniref:prepilin n=1 Tax=Bordetella petrii TaxID=94624 RepID=UPI001A96AB44|nr:prepilin [Bordetella petrii]MBO1110719.1 prepilin [Bordetella petrii]
MGITTSHTRAAGSSRPHPGQAGFALLELTLAVAVASMILIWGANRLVHQVDDAASRAAGVWMLELKRGLDNMLRQHFDSLAEGVPALGANGLPLYADPLAPRLAELKAHGHLPAAFPESGALGEGVAIRILRDARCPGAGCRLDALAYGAGPVLLADGSAPDLMRLSAAIEAAGGYGGAATAARVRGANFDFPNPPEPAMPALAPGTLAVWAGFGAADYDLYVRRRDTRDPDLQGGLSVAGALSSAGRLHTGEFLSLGGVAVAGTACPGGAGLVARSANGGLLDCRGGVWTAMQGSFGGAYALNRLLGCGHSASSANPVTGACSCPRGYAAVLVSKGLWADNGSTTFSYVCVGPG